MPINEELLEILACPKCKGDLVYIKEPEEGFGCKNCKLFYAIEDDIPNFLIEEAKPWNPEETSKKENNNE